MNRFAASRLHFKTDLILQIGSGPGIVISGDKHNSSSGLPHIGQGLQNVKVVVRNRLPVFEPEIEEISDDVQYLGFSPNKAKEGEQPFFLFLFDIGGVTP